jgi:hypothetical protein
MRIRNRLIRLERISCLYEAPEASMDLDPPLSDEEEADRTGEFLWAGFDLDKRYPPRWGLLQSPSAAQRAWHEVAEAAWAADIREYHVGLRPFALAVWLELKPFVLQHRQTHGTWISTGKRASADTLTPEEFDRLPLAERVAVLREHRPGYWSKHGPLSRSRRQGKRRER